MQKNHTQPEILQMTVEEAIEFAEREIRLDYSPTTTAFCKTALQSFQAWNNVLDGLNEYLEEYDGIDENGHHNLKWCAISEAKMLVEENIKAITAPQK